MSISQLLSDRTSRDVTPEFLEPSTHIFDQQTPSPCSPPQQRPSTIQKLQSSNLTTKQIKVPGELLGPQEMDQPLPRSPTTIRPITHTTTVLHTEGQLASGTEQVPNQGIPNVNLLPSQLESEQRADRHLSTPATAGATHSFVASPGIQTPTSTASVKKGRPRTLTAHDEIKVEERAPTRNLILGETPRPKRGRKPKVKEPSQPSLSSSVIDSTKPTSQEASVVPVAELPSVAMVPSISAVGAASKRTRSESPDDEAYADVDLESYRVRNTTIDRQSPILFSSDDDSDQEDYSQHQDLMAYRLEIHKRAQRVHRVYEKQSMVRPMIII